MYHYLKTKRFNRKIRVRQEYVQVEKNVLVIILLASALIIAATFTFRLNQLGAEGISGFDAWTQAFYFAWIGALKPVYLVMSMILFLIGLYASIKFWPMRAKVTLNEQPTLNISKEDIKRKKHPRIIKQWEEIAQKANTKTPENIRLAVMEADALVDFFLKESGYEGEHMADRLGKISRDEVKTLDELWKAHRVRNDIVHTPGYKLSDGQAQEALMAFRAFLIEMGAL